MGRQGKRLSGTARRIVHNVSEFMAMEKRAGRSILRMNVVERVAKACQLSTSTVANIRRQSKVVIPLRLQRNGTPVTENK